MKRGLNMGSGQRKFRDGTGQVEWANVDKVSRPGHEPDWIADGEDLRGFVDDNTIDYYVLSQVYEHFGCGEAICLLKEAHRVLRIGGSLIVSVPNMMALAQRWVAGDISEYIFMVNTYGAYMGNEEDRHKWGTTPGSLKSDMEKAATWQWVKDFDNRPIPGMDVARDWWITCLEARR